MSAPSAVTSIRHVAAYDSDHKRAGYAGFKRSSVDRSRSVPGTWDLPIHAVKYSLYRAAKTFSNTYI
jgi:hypothetical protein